MEEEVMHIHDGVKTIQNEMWSAYKQYLSDQDVKKFNNAAWSIIHRYKEGSAEETFARYLLFAFAPVVNTMAKMRREANG